MDTIMVDQEPHRSVQLIRRIDTRVPAPLLSLSVASAGSSMGRLVDMRLGAGRGAGAGLGAGAGGSTWGGASGSSGGVGTGPGTGTGRWNEVAKSALGTPRSGSGTPARVPSPVVRSREASPGPSRSVGVGGASTGVGTSVGTTRAWVSPSVQAQRERENAAAGTTVTVPGAVVERQGAGAAREGVEVPDDWEDEI
jgi:transcriptional repressor NF-X1